jgi:hypothetical protein
MSTALNRALVHPLLAGPNHTRSDVLDHLRVANDALDDRPLPAPGAAATEQQRAFVLSVAQPGLAGLMDGSISSLAPLFAAAFATHDSRTAFLVGLATAIGAGISMACSEGLSDDGKLSGRGSPWLRGAVCGLMTFLGAAGHTIPFLLPAFLTAALLAAGVVLAELLLIAWMRNRYMDTPLLSATFQVVVGGVAVFVAGILLGSA